MYKGKTFIDTIPMWVVSSCGCTLEYTHMRSEAESAFKRSKSSRTKLFKMNQETGLLKLIKEKTFIPREMRATLASMVDKLTIKF